MRYLVSGLLVSFKRSHQLTVSLNMSSSTPPRTALVAVCQLNCKANKDDNLAATTKLIVRAAVLGCKMVFLPECFDMVGESQKQTLDNSESLTGPLVTEYRQLAKDNNVWLSLGGLHEKSSTNEADKSNNAHIVVNSSGEIASVYRKVHLFNLEIPGVIRLKESEFSVAGDRIVEPVDTPVGKVGLGICYDVRFAEFGIALAKAGADLLTYPSAFTVPTGLAHWETLLRARAIENQCYVIAAAQTGAHNAKRSSYGHAMIIDPWGAVVAQCSDEPFTLAVAEINFDFLKTARLKLPIWTDRRPELYGSITAPVPRSDIDSQLAYTFGAVQVQSSQVFYKTQLSYAFVNHRPVLPGHVLIGPLRADAKRLADLSSSEVLDLFTTVQKVQRVIEQEFRASASTIAVQDGVEAGRSIDHLHVHLLPRKESDFGGKTDQIYSELQGHDKVESTRKSPPRTDDEMKQECLKLRSYFN